VSPHARVNGVSLYYEDAGRGRPLVLAHGFSATARMWEGQVATFCDRYRIITYDARGQGRSEVPADPGAYSQPIMVEDLRALIAHLGLDRPVICGLSMGGNVVLNLALAHPEMVSGAVICGTGAGSEDPAAWAGTIQGWIDLLEGPGIEAFAEMYIADPILASYANRSPNAREFLWKAITSNTARGVIGWRDWPCRLPSSSVTATTGARGSRRSWRPPSRGPSWWRSRTPATWPIWSNQRSSTVP
jgi:pimeloyl-ACP methyl ester carboxylesterase